MIEVTVADKIYEIYENRAECDKPVKTLQDCDTGDYILSVNGYYVPVLLTRMKEVKKDVFIKLINIPGRVVQYSITKPKGFYYKVNEDRTNINARDFMWIELINNGTDVMKAGKIAYTQFGTSKFLTLIRNPNIMNKLKVRLSMQSMSERLKENKITEEFIADTLTEIIKDKDPKNNTLRKWALETTMKIIETQTQADTSKSGMLQSASSSLGELIASTN